MSLKIKFILIILISLMVQSCKDKRYFTVSKIKDAAKLATTETIIDKIVIGKKEKKLVYVIKLGEARFVCFTQVRVKTGIDLKKISQEDVKINGKQISLVLPPVEVITFSYPFESFHIDSTLLKNSLFARIDINDMEELYRKAEIDIRTQLPLMGIKEATQKRTRHLLESLLRSLDYEEISIAFKDGPMIQPVKETDIQ